VKYKFEDYYGSGRLVAEDKSFHTIPESGVAVRVAGIDGMLYSIPDSSSHCGGHGMGGMKSCQGVVSPADMRLIVIKHTWEDVFDIEVIF